ncbi:hypothetical protein C0991_006225 [Blastosporella zonata]|nr:hypothetical protein C0991_006225 [Blastosporella zonata]
MNQEFQAEVIATCKTHEDQTWCKDDYRACVCVGESYFVKYGTPTDLEPETAMQEFIFNHAQQPQTPRIARIVHHFVDEWTMYLVMERITLQKSPPDLAKVEEAVRWLSEVPLPSNPMLGPVGGGRIRHKFFKDYIAPFNFPDLGSLDAYIKRAYSLLSAAAQRKVSPVSVSGDRLIFTQSDMDDSNFGSMKPGGRS